MSGGLTQIPCQEGMSSEDWSTDAYSSLFVTIDYTLFDFEIDAQAFCFQ